MTLLTTLGLGSRLKRKLPFAREDYHPTKIDEGLKSSIDRAMTDSPVFKIRPPKDSDGIAVGRELLKSFHIVRTGRWGVRNHSPAVSFEIWYTGEQVQFSMTADRDVVQTRIRNQIQNVYPGTAISEREQKFPEYDVGDYVAGGVAIYDRPFFYPIRTPFGEEPFQKDPLGALTAAFHNDRLERQRSLEDIKKGCRLVIQVTFLPAHDEWSKAPPFGVDCETKADKMRRGGFKDGIFRTIFGSIERKDPSPKQLKAADMVANQRGEPGFYTSIRVIGIADNPDVVHDRVKNVCEQFNVFANKITEQTFQPKPRTDDELKITFEQMASRKTSVSVLDQLSDMKMILTLDELSGLVHLPNDSIGTGDIDWMTAKVGPGVPAEAPQFEEYFEIPRVDQQEEAQGTTFGASASDQSVSNEVPATDGAGNDESRNGRE
jgi:hypothetical protein